MQYRLKDSYLIYQKRQINLTVQKSMRDLQYIFFSTILALRRGFKSRYSSHFIESGREIKVYCGAGSKKIYFDVPALITPSITNTICIITVLHMYYEILTLILQLKIRLNAKRVLNISPHASPLALNKKKQCVIKGDLKVKSTSSIKVVNFLKIIFWTVARIEQNLVHKVARRFRY